MTPNIDGYTYYLNGNEIQVSETLGSMIYLKVEAGDSVLRVIYKYPHLKSWILVIIVSIIMVIILILLYKYRILDKCENIVCLAMNVVFILLFTLIYVFGIILSVRAFFI